MSGNLLFLSYLGYTLGWTRIIYGKLTFTHDLRLLLFSQFCGYVLGGSVIMWKLDWNLVEESWMKHHWFPVCRSKWQDRESRQDSGAEKRWGHIEVVGNLSPCLDAARRVASSCTCPVVQVRVRRWLPWCGMGFSSESWPVNTFCTTSIKLMLLFSLAENTEFSSQGSGETEGAVHKCPSLQCWISS